MLTFFYYITILFKNIYKVRSVTLIQLCLHPHTLWFVTLPLSSTQNWSMVNGQRSTVTGYGQRLTVNMNQNIIQN